MHEYDSVLKSLLTGSRNSLFERITGANRGKWLNVELPRVTQRRVDLLFEVILTLELILLELQSFNDPLLALRMAEYALLVARVHKRFPRMYVLYVGSERLRMPTELVTPCLTCHYTVIDIREWDAEALLEGAHPADAILAILGRHSDRPETIRRILQRIAKMEVHERNIAFSKLTILAGMRNLAGVVEQEAKRMPIHYDIRDHETIGPVIRRERAEGEKSGEAKGRREEAISLLQRLIATRFGSISTTAKRRLAKLTLPELEDLAVRVLTAKGLSDLFGR